MNEENTVRRVALETLAGGCSGAACPTVYRSGSDDLVIQGDVANDLVAGGLPEGEQAVRISISLVREALGRI